MFFCVFEVKTAEKKFLDFFILCLQCRHVCDILHAKQ